MSPDDEKWLPSLVAIVWLSDISTERDESSDSNALVLNIADVRQRSSEMSVSTRSRVKDDEKGTANARKKVHVSPVIIIF